MPLKMTIVDKVKYLINVKTEHALIPEYVIVNLLLLLGQLQWYTVVTIFQQMASLFVHVEQLM